MINLAGLFDGLLQFFGLVLAGSITGTRAQFVTGVLNMEIDTEDNANLFVDRYLQCAHDLGMITQADFSVLVARVKAVNEVAPVTAGAKLVYAALEKEVVFIIAKLQAQLALMEPITVQLSADLSRYGVIVSWIQANAPSADARDSALRLLEQGKLRMEGGLAALQREAARIEATLELLGAES